MNRIAYIVTLLLGIPLLTVLYYNLAVDGSVDKIFLTISTFLFSIFTGFFISRQAGRFNKVRETVTAFDGKMSGVYRASQHISLELQKAIGEVLVAHYRKILDSGRWNIHFREKSTTLTNIHELLDTHVKEEEVTKLSNQSIGAIIKGLASAQDLRKQMVALEEERIPMEQWVLILFFAAMLIMTTSLIESQTLLFPSLLKAAFVVSVVSVLGILYRLNRLAYSERIMGEHSANDVLNIIDGSR